MVRPQAVDINSGVEISPGKKDPSKIREIIKVVRQTDHIISNRIGSPDNHKNVFR